MRSSTVAWGIGIAVTIGVIVSCLRETPREMIVRIANDYVGSGEDRAFYQSACLPDNYSGEWCGIFALFVLHMAGVANDVCWEVGKGFLYRLSRTTQPQPGDIAYKDAPWQHHAIVESYDPANKTFVGIDGNGTGGVVTKGERSTAGYVFYSIEEWV